MINHKRNVNNFQWFWDLLLLWKWARENDGNVRYSSNVIPRVFRRGFCFLFFIYFFFFVCKPNITFRNWGWIYRFFSKLLDSRCHICGAFTANSEKTLLIRLVSLLILCWQWQLPCHFFSANLYSCFSQTHLYTILLKDFLIWIKYRAKCRT